jgi:hypothetical protein
MGLKGNRPQTASAVSLNVMWHFKNILPFENIPIFGNFEKK